MRTFGLGAQITMFQPSTSSNNSDSSLTAVPSGCSSVVTIIIPRSSGYKRMLFTVRIAAYKRSIAVIVPATMAMIRLRIRNSRSNSAVPVFSTQAATISSGVPKWSISWE